MKINLLLCSDNILAGFRNLDPYPSTGDKLQTFSETKETGQVDNLDHMCDDAEAEELIAIDVIDYLNSSTKAETLTNWAKKLAHGASFTIGGVDLYETSKAVVRCALTFDEAQEAIYGSATFPFGQRRGLYTMERMTQELTNRGLTIKKSHFDGMRYVITAVRA